MIWNNLVTTKTACVPLPELRDGCLPWVCTGGGWARCCYDTEVPIYKGVWRSHARGGLDMQAIR